jgi:hypothetical protein
MAHRSFVASLDADRSRYQCTRTLPFGADPHQRARTFYIWSGAMLIAIRGREQTDASDRDRLTMRQRLPGLLRFEVVLVVRSNQSKALGNRCQFGHGMYSQFLHEVVAMPFDRTLGRFELVGDLLI